MKKIIVDVREKDEFANEHIPDSINIPLSELERQAPSIIKALAPGTITLMCRSGKRAGLAKQQLEQLKLNCTFEVFEGGILEWKKSNPTHCAGPTRFPIMRQVQTIAGILILTGVVLSKIENPNWIYLSGFAGLGLTVAGLTGFCGMAEFLSLMPWNKCK